MEKEIEMIPYKEEMEEKIKDYINENIDIADYKENREELEEKLNDDLWDEDSVTGNGSGSYYFSTSRSKLQVEKYGDEYLKDAVSEFGVDAETVSDKFLEGDYEYFDVTIRCYLLGQCISEVLDELEENGDFEEEEQE